MPECSICLEKYDSIEKIPKFLGCGHTFCKKCLDSLYAKYNGNIICPKCRGKCTTKPEQLTTNFDIIESNNFECEFNIGLIGDTGTGKTSIIERFVKDSFNPNHLSTSTIDFVFKDVKIKNHKINLRIWDTAGQERYQSLCKDYIRKFDGIFFVFDVCDIDTFIGIKKWLETANDSKKNENVILFLLGNKTDGKRKVKFEEASTFADENGMEYGETSALIGDNIKTSFHNMAKIIFKKNKNDIISDDETFSLSKKITINRKKKKCC